MNAGKYVNKVNSLFDARKDRKYKMVGINGGDYPAVVHFQDKDIGCFFLSPLGTEDTVELKKLKIYDSNKGYGAKLLKLLCDEADKYKITVWVWPLPEESKKAIPLNKLKSWYIKFGFEQNDGSFMIRKPNED